MQLKSQIIAFLFLAFLCNYEKSEAQSKDNIEDLIYSKIKGREIPSKFFKYCNLNYALIKMETKDGIVKAVDSMNDISSEVLSYFKSFENFKFPPELKIKDQSIVFACIGEPSRTCEDSKSKQMNLSIAVRELLGLITKQLKNEPNTIYAGEIYFIESIR